MVKAVLLAVLAVATTLPAAADSISQKITGKASSYSKERPDSDWYGTGAGGRLVEASELRFKIDRALQDQNFDQAAKMARKACMLDPHDPDTHILLARALTGVYDTQKDPKDEALLAQCLLEWRMIWHHDADQFNQQEAKHQSWRLGTIEKQIMLRKKLHLQQEKLARKDAKDAIAQDRAKEAQPSDKEEAKPQLAQRRKRFLFF